VNDDFVSASVRHAMDSRHLLEAGRQDNADYLAGYAVECALKAVIDLGGGRPQAYGHDLIALSGTALDLAVLLCPGLRRYRSDRIPAIDVAAATWNPSLRYSRTGSLTHAQANQLVDAAREAFEGLVIPLILDGRTEVPR